MEADDPAEKQLAKRRRRDSEPMTRPHPLRAKNQADGEPEIIKPEATKRKPMQVEGKEMFCGYADLELQQTEEELEKQRKKA